MKKNDNNQIDQQSILIYLLLLFYLVYLICAILLQIRSNKPPSAGGCAFDVFTGSLLMIISLIAIIIATQLYDNILKLLFWLVVSTSAGALAIDEWFEFHEYTDRTFGGWWAFGEDDYIKIALWLSACVGIYILYKVEKFSPKILFVLLIGLLFHSIYLITDMGDGEFFTLPFSNKVLMWTEEIMELLFVKSYLAAILLFHQKLYLRSKMIPKRSNPT